MKSIKKKLRIGIISSMSEKIFYPLIAQSLT